MRIGNQGEEENKSGKKELLYRFDPGKGTPLGARGPAEGWNHCRVR